MTMTATVAAPMWFGQDDARPADACGASYSARRRRRHSVVTSVTAALALDSSTMVLLVA
jgi:hypothetical protein